MTKQEEIREVIDLYTDDRCLYPSKECKCHSGVGGVGEGYCLSDDDSYTCLMKRFTELGLVIKVDRELPLIGRERAESSVTRTDCSGRQYTPTEWEDNVRYVIDGAEIQRDKDKFDSGYVAVGTLIQETTGEG